MRGDAKYYMPDEEKGGYRYIGKRSRFSQTGEKLRFFKRACLLLALAAPGAFVLAGILEAGETRAFYVGLPYAAALLPAGLGLEAAFRTLRAEASMTVPQFRRGPKRLMLCARAGAILSAMAIVGWIVRAARGGAVSCGFFLPVCLMLAAFGGIWALCARNPVLPVD